MAAARAESSNRSHSDVAVSGVRSMLNVSEQDLDKARRIKRARELMSNDVAQAEAAATNASAPVAEGEATTNRVVRDTSSLSNSIDNLKKGWQMRTELARNNFVKRVDLDESAETRFDVVIEAMNLRLGATVDAWSARLQEKGYVNEEDGVRMMNEMSTALVITYDEMDRTLPEGWREKAGEKFDLVRFIDPEVLTPLQDLEDIDDHTEGDEEIEE